MNFHQVAGTAVDESGFINFLDNNPDAVIFDLRWMELYEKYHINGSHLIDSSWTDETIQTTAVGILDASGATSDTGIGMYCNCGDGAEASKLDSYLRSEGYTNTVWLSHSFSYWTNTKYLVKGTKPVGPPVTEISTGGSDPLIDPLILVVAGGGILLLGGGSYFYLANTNKIKNIDTEMTRVESKKTKELESISKLLSDKKTAEETKKDKKPRRR